MTVTGRILTYLVAGAIAAMLIAYGFGRLSAILGVHDAAITAASRAQLQLHPALVRERAKRKAAEQQLLAVNRTTRVLTDSLERLALMADSAARDSAARAGQPAPAVSPWKAVADSNRAGWDRCTVVYRSCAERAASAEAEADSLSRKLTAQLAVHDRRCGLFGGVGVAAGWRIGAGLQLGVGCRLWP